MPPGVDHLTMSPTRQPISAVPIGVRIEMRLRSISAFSGNVIVCFSISLVPRSSDSTVEFMVTTSAGNAAGSMTAARSSSLRRFASAVLAFE